MLNNVTKVIFANNDYSTERFMLSGLFRRYFKMPPLSSFLSMFVFSSLLHTVLANAPGEPIFAQKYSEKREGSAVCGLSNHH